MKYGFKKTSLELRFRDSIKYGILYLSYTVNWSAASSYRTAIVRSSTFLFLQPQSRVTVPLTSFGFVPRIGSLQFVIKKFKEKTPDSAIKSVNSMWIGVVA